MTAWVPNNPSEPHEPGRCEMEPVIAVTSLGVVALCLMLAAFVTAARSPRFPDAPPGTRPPGRLPRGLMLAGAALAVVFALLMLVPGALPWVGFPEGYVDLCLSAAGGAAVAASAIQTLRRGGRVGGAVPR